MNRLFRSIQATRFALQLADKPMKYHSSTITWEQQRVHHNPKLEFTISTTSSSRFESCSSWTQVMNSSHAFFTFNRFTRDQQLNQLRESFWILIVYPNSINQVSIILKNIKGIMLTKGGESRTRSLFGEASISKPTWLALKDEACYASLSERKSGRRMHCASVGKD